MITESERAHWGDRLDRVRKLVHQDGRVAWVDPDSEGEATVRARGFVDHDAPLTPAPAEIVAPAGAGAAERRRPGRPRKVAAS